MISFYNILKEIVERKFPDTKDVKYFVCTRDGYPHMAWVLRDWRRKEKCFRIDADRYCAWRCFDDRENLGSLDIESRINGMSAMSGTLVPTNHL